MKNKLYQVQGVGLSYCNIVSAPNAKEAKLLGANTESTEGVAYFDLRVRAIKGGVLWIQKELDLCFKIIGKGFIYTDIKSGLIYWDEFVEEVEKQNRLVWSKEND